MNLGQLIGGLENREDARIPLGFGEPSSWRGSYSEVSFELEENVTIGMMLKHARSALGATFTGYKGGEFKMHELSDCYLAEYGECGDSIGAWFFPYLDAVISDEKEALK